MTKNAMLLTDEELMNVAGGTDVHFIRGFVDGVEGYIVRTKEMSLERNPDGSFVKYHSIKGCGFIPLNDWETMKAIKAKRGLNLILDEK